MSKRAGKGKVTLTKTGMYDGVGGTDEKKGEQDLGSSMVLESEESELGGFRERRARLARAARLLNEGGRSVVEKETGRREV